MYIPGRLSWDRTTDRTGATSEEAAYVAKLQARINALETDRQNVRRDINAAIGGANDASAQIDWSRSANRTGSDASDIGHIGKYTFKLIGYITPPGPSDLADLGEALADYVIKRANELRQEARAARTEAERARKEQLVRIFELNAKNHLLLARQQNLLAELRFANEMLQIGRDQETRTDTENDLIGNRQALLKFSLPPW